MNKNFSNLPTVHINEQQSITIKVNTAPCVCGVKTSHFDYTSTIIDSNYHNFTDMLFNKEQLQKAQRYKQAIQKSAKLR